ncbi:hypothetical protein H5410_005076 [Solanum commersonii]|uniref:Uncharacterized protein n=1 Tax=Solanum commersonii TaxID=4109 RepID=A0A9J6A659_SOLCO|nr:hypothetical protein H5410_005076 [Solanum commersonii]
MVVLSPHAIKFCTKRFCREYEKQETIHGTNELSAEFWSTLGKSQPLTGVLQRTHQVLSSLKKTLIIWAMLLET